MIEAQTKLAFNLSAYGVYTIWKKTIYYLKKDLSVKFKFLSILERYIRTKGL